MLRELGPQAPGAVARRYGEFADAEDAVQEALVTAAWPLAMPDNPGAWMITRRAGGSSMSTVARPLFRVAG